MVLFAFPFILMLFLKPAMRYALEANGYPGANGAEQVVPGQAVSQGFIVAGMTSLAFFSEYAWFTWDRLRMTAATTADIIAGKILPRFALSCAQFAVLLTLGVPLLGLEVEGSWLALVPIIVAYALCLVTTGVAITAYCRSLQEASAVAYGSLVLFSAIGGALVPITLLPGWIRGVGALTPTYWAMRGFRSVILDGADAVLLPTLVMLGMSAALAAAAAFRFRALDSSRRALV